MFVHTKRTLRDHVNSSRDDAREEAITLITRLSLVYIGDYISSMQEFPVYDLTNPNLCRIIREKEKRNLQAAFKLFAKLLGEQQMIYNSSLNYYRQIAADIIIPLFAIWEFYAQTLVYVVITFVTNHRSRD